MRFKKVSNSPSTYAQEPISFFTGISSKNEQLELELPGVLKQSHFYSKTFQDFVKDIKEEPKFHGKLWQFYAINHFINANFYNSSIKNKLGIGFGVGKEPMPAFFASRGAKICATDFFENKNTNWASTSQMSSNLQDLNDRGICDPDTFEKLVSLSSANMNYLENTDLPAADFIWSTCALGHIGGYQNGLNFIQNSLSLLKPGGIAVHTTELDIGAEKKVLESVDLNLYKQADLELTLAKIQQSGFTVPTHSFTLGIGGVEKFEDFPPYSNWHLRLNVLGHTVLPVVLVIKKPQN
jgi:hypothetical protein